MSPRPFQVLGLDHIVLRVANLADSLNFYCELLGGTLERELPDLGLYQVRLSQHLIDLVPIGSKLGGDGVLSQSARNLEHFCLLLDVFDEKELADFLEAAGLAGSTVATRYGAGGYGPSLYISDPDGNTVELKGG